MWHNLQNLSRLSYLSRTSIFHLCTHTCILTRVTERSSMCLINLCSRPKSQKHPYIATLPSPLQIPPYPGPTPSRQPARMAHRSSHPQAPERTRNHACQKHIPRPAAQTQRCPRRSRATATNAVRRGSGVGRPDRPGVIVGGKGATSLRLQV